MQQYKRASCSQESISYGAQSGCSATARGLGSQCPTVEAVEKCIPSTQLQPPHSLEGLSAHTPHLRRQISELNWAEDNTRIPTRMGKASQLSLQADGAELRLFHTVFQPQFLLTFLFLSQAIVQSSDQQELISPQ